MSNATTTETTKNDTLADRFLAEMENIVARMKREDALTRKHTAFDSLAEMVATEGYVPTISALSASDRLRRRELVELADAYDARQEMMEDPRRAFRI